jgi:tetratricopeptide (TPR) repeat protein
LDVRKEIINFVKTLSNHKNDLQAMNFFKALFGGKEEKPEDKKKAEEEKDFDVLKYDGVRALRSGQYDYAIRCFTHALGMKEDLEIRDYASQAMIRADRLPEAFEQLRKIAEAQPENMQVFIRMANVAYMMEDYTAMADACEKAILIDNTDAEAVYLYAKACIGHGDTTNAIAMLTKTLKLNPEYHEARLLRAETLLSTNDTDGADEDTTQLMKNNLENEDILILKARVERAKGNANDAILYYDKTIEANPFNANAYKERGELKTEMGDRTNGLNDIKYATELLNQQDGDAGNENIEKKVGDAYKNANPFGV